MKRIILSILLALLANSVLAIEMSEIEALAERGFAPAQFSLGIAYDTGDGVRQDHSKAVKWYRKAALQGHKRAQNNLAASYGRGEGVPQNLELALKWYQIAAQQGDPLARQNLSSYGH